MKNIIYTLLVALAAIAFSPSASAIPGYTRQTGMACESCHFQSFPALNATGRAFKSGGYTMMGSQEVIEGSDGLSLPQTLNAGVVMKIRYQKDTGDRSVTPAPTSKSDGQLQVFDELLFMVGGRVGENVGVQLESDLLGGNPLVKNFKMPFIFDVGGVNAGVIPFVTNGQGVAYGFELLNTGAVRGQRIMEARTSFSAQQWIGTGSKAEGFALVASNDQYFANFTKWSPRSVGQASGSPTANYFRLAFTPTVADWDVGFGGQLWSGVATQHATATTVTDIKTEAFALDAQAQGELAGMPVGIYLTHANASASDSAVGEAPNLFNGAGKAKRATTIAGQLGIVPGKSTLQMAYRKGDNGNATGNADNSLMVGATYHVIQNVQLQVNHEMFSGSAYDTKSNRLTTLMLFAAF